MRQDVRQARAKVLAWNGVCSAEPGNCTLENDRYKGESCFLQQYLEKALLQSQQCLVLFPLSHSWMGSVQNLGKNVPSPWQLLSPVVYMPGQGSLGLLTCSFHQTKLQRSL